MIGGGRYDSLPSVFGRNDLGATGVAGGVERIILSLENQNSMLQEQDSRISILYVNDEMQPIAINLASTLRSKGILIDIDLTGKSLKKQMEQSTNAKFALIIAPNEFANGTVIIRDMTNRTEKKIKVENLLSDPQSVLNL